LSARSRSLRFRLLSISIALAVVGMAALSVVAIVALRNNLLERVDAELLAVPSFSGAAPGQTTGPLPVGSAQFLNNTVITRLDGSTGEVADRIVGPVLASAPPPDLSSVSAAIRSGAPLNGKPSTVGGVGDSGYTYRIRVLATSLTGSDVVVIAKSLADIQTTVARVSVSVAVLSGIVVAGLIGIGIPVIRVGLRPLRDVERAAERIAGGDMSVRAPHTDEPGEVGSLARTFNGMVDQIEGAFDAQQASEDQLRRFLADASHELRTPLTSIRAYAELFRQGALLASPDSLQAMNRIEAEAARMGRLVEDLLVLARLDQHPVLRTERVDMAALVREVAADTAAAAPDHVVEVEIDKQATLLVGGDEQGLRQVVVNLLRNAVVHTPAGCHVRANASSDGKRVVVTVADDGPGMAVDAAAHAFERFYRPDTGRVRGPAGTGLGLAIVKSMVAAHGGDVELRTAPGQGACFTVTFPAAGSQPGVASEL
jgi:two-component system, OmpR family, sensor kinase